MEQQKRYGCFFAILPNDPSVSSVALKAAWDSAIASSQYSFTTTHDRVADLIHPQLPQPLKFIEVSCLLTISTIASTTEDDPEYVCNEFIKQLLSLEHKYGIGNAELLLILPETVIPVLPTELPATNDLQQALVLFQQYGVVSLSNVLDTDQSETMKSHTMTIFQTYYNALTHRHDKKTHFQEIMARDDNRFDFRLDLPSTEMTTSGKLNEKQNWMPFIQELLGQDCSLIRHGCVLSLPGTGIQYWHSDGIHVGPAASLSGPAIAAPVHALCVFCPLIDLTETTGYTEFWAGSHQYATLLSKKGEQSLPGGTRGIINKGSCVVYDYRTIHRGMPNSSNVARPVCYFLYTKKGFEFVEDQNFANQSVFAE